MNSTISGKTRQMRYSANIGEKEEKNRIKGISQVSKKLFVGKKKGIIKRDKSEGNAEYQQFYKSHHDKLR